MPTLWDTPASVLYDFDWTQCRNCKRWHQVSEEFIDLVNSERSDEVDVTAIDPQDTTGPGSTCPDCGGVMGRWIPENAIGSREDGTYILRGDPEDPNRSE